MACAPRLALVQCAATAGVFLCGWPAAPHKEWKFGGYAVRSLRDVQGEQAAIFSKNP